MICVKRTWSKLFGLTEPAKPSAQSLMNEPFTKCRSVKCFRSLEMRNKNGELNRILISADFQRRSLTRINTQLQSTIEPIMLECYARSIFNMLSKWFESVHVKSDLIYEFFMYSQLTRTGVGGTEKSANKWKWFNPKQLQEHTKYFSHFFGES